MLLGIEIHPVMLLFGGGTLFVLLVLQMLVGMRKIRFKGALHHKVHKYGAWVLVAFGVLHGAISAVYLLGL